MAWPLLSKLAGDRFLFFTDSMDELGGGVKQKTKFMVSNVINVWAEIRTRAVALVAGFESRHANRYTMRRQLSPIIFKLV